MIGPNWAVIVPQKRLSAAKSRLRLDETTRCALARAMFRDTVASLVATRSVLAVMVVAECPADADLLEGTGAHRLVEPGLTLNEAILTGAQQARHLWPTCHLAAMPADIPGLKSSELDAALRPASVRPRTFVADRHRTGTTLLTAQADHALNPQFGPGSYRAHLESGAWENRDRHLASLRHDVDNLGDLAALTDLGGTRALGPHLQAALTAFGWRRHEEVS